MKKKIFAMIFLLGLAYLAWPVDSMVYADDDSSQTGDSSEQDPNTPPPTDPGDTGNGGATGDNPDPNPNPDQGSNDSPVDGFGGNSTSKPSHSTTIDTMRPATVIDNSKETTNNPFRTRIGLDRTDTDDMTDDVPEDIDSLTDSETITEPEKNPDDIRTENTTPLQNSDHERRNWVLLITSVLTSLGVVGLAVFASVVMGRTNARNKRLATK